MYVYLLYQKPWVTLQDRKENVPIAPVRPKGLWAYTNNCLERRFVCYLEILGTVQWVEGQVKKADLPAVFACVKRRSIFRKLQFNVSFDEVLALPVNDNIDSDGLWVEVGKLRSTSLWVRQVLELTNGLAEEEFVRRCVRALLDTALIHKKLSRARVAKTLKEQFKLLYRCVEENCRSFIPFEQQRCARHVQTEIEVLALQLQAWRQQKRGVVTK